MSRLIFKILAPKDISAYRSKLLDLYDPERKRPRKYTQSLRSAMCNIVAIRDNRIVGAVRLISDGYMCALILDLLVAPDCRHQGIGGALVRRSARFCERKGIKNIELIADPRDPGLVPFYADLGFEYSPDNGVHMKHNKRDHAV